jgi:hypothetical protein
MSDYDIKLVEGIKYCKAMILNPTFMGSGITLTIEDSSDDTETTITVRRRTK